MRTLSISTVLFDGYPMETAVDEIARGCAMSIEPAYIRGYQGAFSGWAAARLRRLIADAGVSTTAVSAHFDLSLACVPEPN